MSTTTNKPAHTPGPWITAGRAVYTPSKFSNGRDSGQIMVCQCFAEADRELTDCGDFLGAVKVPGNDCEADANAHLIACAPDMLAELKRITFCVESIVMLRGHALGPVGLTETIKYLECAKAMIERTEGVK